MSMDVYDIEIPTIPGPNIWRLRCVYNINWIAFTPEIDLLDLSLQITFIVVDKILVNWLAPGGIVQLVHMCKLC